MSGTEARGAILSALKGSPSALAIIVVVVLFLRKMETSEALASDVLGRMSVQLEAMAKEFSIRNQMTADAIRDSARNTEAISKITVVLDRLVDQASTSSPRGR